MKNVIIKFMKSYRAPELQVVNSLAIDVLNKFSDAEKELYSLLPETPATPVIAAALAVTVSPVFEMETQKATVSPQEIELMLLQRFSALGLALIDLNTTDTDKIFTLGFMIRPRSNDDAQRLSSIIEKLKFDLGEETSVKLFTSSKSKDKYKKVRVQVEILKDKVVSKGFNHATA